jgi:hypothetical protein
MTVFIFPVGTQSRSRRSSFEESPVGENLWDLPDDGPKGSDGIATPRSFRAHFPLVYTKPPPPSDRKGRFGIFCFEIFHTNCEQTFG